MKNSYHYLGSNILRALVWTAVALTVGLLVTMIGVLVVNGVPHVKASLFAWTYTSENVSLLPAAVNTLVMTLLALLIAVPAGIGAAIYTNEYATRGNRFVACKPRASAGASSIATGTRSPTIKWRFRLFAAPRISRRALGTPPSRASAMRLSESRRWSGGRAMCASRRFGAMFVSPCRYPWLFGVK